MKMVLVTPEEWGEFKSDLKHIKSQVNKIDDLPCNSRDNNPIARLESIEKQMGWTQKLGYALAGLVLAATAAITKFFGLISGGDAR